MSEEKKRIPFYVQEVAWMDAHDPRAPGAEMSYGDIARYLNEKWPQFNKGQRTRDSIIGYYKEKRKRHGLRFMIVAVPKDITITPTEIQRLIISHCNKLS